MRSARRHTLGSLAAFAIVASLLGAMQPASALGNDTNDIRITTINSEDGSPNIDPCYILVDFSNEGCDRNDDGSVTFDDVPSGTYTVHQTADLGDHSVRDFEIVVDGSTTGFTAYTEPVEDLPGTEDIEVKTVASDGSPVVDICFELAGYSNEGCDDNRNGVITFNDIPHGSYTLHQTRSTDPHTGTPLGPDQVITVSEDATSFTVVIDWVPA